MHAGNLCNVVQCLFRWLNLKSWENIWICCEQILEYLSKVNKTTFASDMFRVFLFSSHKKFNWLLLQKILCSGYFFTLVSRTFRKLDFLQCRGPYFLKCLQELTTWVSIQISSGNMKGTILRHWDLQVLIIANVFFTYLKRGDDIYSRRAHLFPSRRPLIRIQQWSAMVMGEMPECSGAAKHDAYWAGRMATVAHMVALLTQTGQLGPGQAWSLYRPIVCLRCIR